MIIKHTNDNTNTNTNTNIDTNTNTNTNTNTDIIIIIIIISIIMALLARWNRDSFAEATSGQDLSVHSTFQRRFP